MSIKARIVILNYNGEEMLAKCLPSLREAVLHARTPTAITVLPLAQLIANASITSCRSSSGIVSARGAGLMVVSSCDIASFSFLLLRLCDC